MPALPTETIRFETTEGTWMSVDVSPDGKTLVFDLLGDLYRLPIAGGKAIPITAGMAWDQGPRFSPDGKHVYFVSDRRGHKNLWRLDLADQTAEQVTRFDADIMGGVNWALGGKGLVFGLARGRKEHSEIILHLLDLETLEAEPINEPDGPVRSNPDWPHETLRGAVRVYSGVGAANGDVYYSEALDAHSEDVTLGSRSAGVRIYEFDNSSSSARAITPQGAAYDEYKPQLSHDGKRLAYFRQYPTTNTELRLRELETGRDWAIIELGEPEYATYTRSDDSRPNYAFLPDDSGVVFWHHGKIYRVFLNGKHHELIPFRVSVEREVVERALPPVKEHSDHEEATTIRWPTISKDGRFLVFVATGYIWSKDLDTGVLRKLTAENELAYMPSLSPDDRRIAYTSFDLTEGKFGPGRLMIMDADGARRRELLRETNRSYILPSWSHDGTKIALIQTGVSGIPSAFGWTSTVDGGFNTVERPARVSTGFGSYPNAYFVGFDETDDRLLYSYPLSGTRTGLFSADLDGLQVDMVAHGTSEIRGITPSADLRRLALTRHDDAVFVLPFERDVRKSVGLTLDQNAQKIGAPTALFLNWRNSARLIFGLGKHVHHIDFDTGELISRRISVPFDVPRGQGVVALTGARLITVAEDGDGAGPIIENGTMIIDGSRIVALGAQDEVDIPGHARVVNANGKTIVPGFLDTHYHARASYGSFGLPIASKDDTSSRIYGITAAWNAGDGRGDSSAFLADLVAAGRVVGPRWSHVAGGAIHPYRNAPNYASAFASAELRRELDADVMKEYQAQTRQERQWLVAAAIEQNLGIVSHLDRFDHMMTLIVDGYTGGDHTDLPAPLFKDVQVLLSETGYIWTPHLFSASSNIGGSDYYVGNHRDGERDYLSAIALKRPQELAKYGRLVATEIERLQPLLPYESRRVSKLAATIADAASVGARIAASGHHRPGFMVHMELWHLWRGGMPPGAVLRAATMNNAEKIGWQEEVGSLEVGKLVDFLILDENPLDDIINTLSIDYTLQGGVFYDADTGEKVDPMDLPDCPDVSVPDRICILPN